MIKYTKRHFEGMSESAPFDAVQSHILGVIASMMLSYGLTPSQVEDRYHYVQSLPVEETGCYPERCYQPDLTIYSHADTGIGEKENDSDAGSNGSTASTQAITPPSNSSSWADLSYEEECIEDAHGGKIYVTTRRDFCSTMAKGVKICPRYSTCNDIDCFNFHIRPEYVCNHVTKGAYCDTEGCDKIVIRACRRGKKCNDSECSFRHK
jgi:hypothetical protein